jgi:hypothetical protein
MLFAQQELKRENYLQQELEAISNLFRVNMSNTSNTKKTIIY